MVSEGYLRAKASAECGQYLPKQRLAWPRAAVASLHPCSPVQLSCSYPATPEAAVALSHTQHLLFGRPRLQVVQRMREAGEALRA